MRLRSNANIDLLLLPGFLWQSHTSRLSYDLRSSRMNLKVLKARTNYFRNNFASASVKLWNSLPSSLKEERLRPGRIYYLQKHHNFSFIIRRFNIVCDLFLQGWSKGGARVVQWWEHSPPTNVARFQILASTPYVGWVCCWFSPLLREVFLRVVQFSPLLKNQHFQIPIRPGIR